MQDNSGASARDYGFLMFLTLLNVMNLLIGNYWRVLLIGIVPDFGFNQY